MADRIDSRAVAEMRQQSAEYALRSSEELNRRILEAAPGGVILLTADGTVLDANAEALRMLGHSLDELQRSSHDDFKGRVIREDGSLYPVDDFPSKR